MKFNVSQAELSKALAKVISVVPTKTTLPVLGNVFLQAKDGALNLTATDLDVSITTRVTVNVVESGGLTVPSRQFSDLIKSLPNIPLEISSDAQLKLTVKCDKGEYRLSGESDDDYPALPVIDEKGVLRMDAKMLSRMIGKSSFAVSSDPLRPALTGVYMQLSKDFKMVATDGHRLAKMTCTRFESTIKEPLNVIVPTKALHEVAKETRDSVSVHFAPNHVRFDLGETQIYSRLLEENYPDYERVIPTNNDKKLRVETGSLLEALKRVSIFANPITHQVRLALKSNELTITAEDADGGSKGVERLAVEFQGDEMQIGYNSHLFLSALGNIDTKEVVVDFKGPTSAGIVTPSEQSENENQMMLVMPVRLND